MTHRLNLARRPRAALFLVSAMLIVLAVPAQVFYVLFISAGVVRGACVLRRALFAQLAPTVAELLTAGGAIAAISVVASIVVYMGLGVGESHDAVRYITLLLTLAYTLNGALLLLAVRSARGTAAFLARAFRERRELSEHELARRVQDSIACVIFSVCVLIVLGWYSRLTIGADLSYAVAVADSRAGPDDDEYAFDRGRDSTLMLAVKLVGAFGGRQCAAAGPDDFVIGLNDERALILPAITTRSMPYMTETTWRLETRRVADCPLVPDTA